MDIIGMCLKLLAIGSFHLLSVAGYNISDPCGGCQRGSTCNLTVSTCICPDLYSGVLCEELKFDCRSEDEACMNDGSCSTQTGECICINSYYGDQCENSADWWNDPTESELKTRSTIVSLAFAILVMASVCFLVICVNIKRVQVRRGDARREQEIRNAVQVDGPPILRVPSNIKRQIKKKDKHIRRESTGCFDIAMPRIPSRTGLRGTTTSPAVLQGSQPPNYSYVFAGESKSGVTIQGDSQVSLPPEYYAAIEQNNSPTSNFTSENDSSGIFMNIDSVGRGDRPSVGRTLSQGTDNSSVILIHTINEVDEMEVVFDEDGAVCFMDDSSSQSSHTSECAQTATQTTMV